FDRFHTVDLPQRLAANATVLAAADLERLRSIAFRLHGGRAYTYTPAGNTIEVAPGDDGAHTVVELSTQDWSDVVWELRSCFALFYAERVTIPRGSFGQLSRWEPVLRAAFDGQSVYDFADPPTVVDAEAKPLDLSGSFTLDDADDDIRDFLERAGFVHLRGVFDDDEIEALRADVQAALAKARPDDNRSWWTTVDGQEVCNRINYLNDQSATLAGPDDA